MANPVQVDDLAARWRPLSPAETTVAEALLADAWSVLLVQLPTLEDRITAGTVSDGAVRYVVSAMVLRVLRNPDGKLEEQIDDYRYRRDSLVSSGSLFLSPEELAMLAPTLARGDSFTISPYGAPGYRTEPDWWV